VLNLGVSGNRVLRDGAGVSALARFDRDVLSRPGSRWIIFLEGINDIGWAALPGAPPQERVSPADLIAGYRQVIAKAHLYGLKVIGGTLLPFYGVLTYSEPGEAIRQEVNTWIRHDGAFDSVVDFDAVMRDPVNSKRLRPQYDSGDHIHPNDEGNRTMADAIDVSSFER